MSRRHLSDASEDRQVRPGAPAARWEAAQVVEGTVVQGDGRGRQLGFPTANVAPAPGGLPPEDALDDGVYAGLLRRADGSIERAAISIGRRPTYYDEGAERLVEAHLLDFAAELYGEQVTVLVGPKVRGQVRFSSEEELVERIEADIEEVRRLTEHRALPEAWRAG